MFAGAATLFTSGLMIGRYIFPLSEKQETQVSQLEDGEIQGEIVRDFIYDNPMGKFYRIELEILAGKMAYPVLALPEELDELNASYKSREEAGIGDIIVVNLKKSNIISLDEKVLLPEDIRLLPMEKDKR